MDSAAKENVSNEMLKPKRKMKTPFQLQTLENAYALDTYPSDATVAELAVKLGLTDRQLKMWFCHKRLKDKKDATGLAVMKPCSGGRGTGGRKYLGESPREDLMAAEPASDCGSGSESESDSRSGSSQFDNGDVKPTVPFRYYESRKAMERRVIACIEAQLGEPLHKDGPALGVKFDELPPGAFGAHAVVAERQDRCRKSYESKSYGAYDIKQVNSAEAETGSDIQANQERIHKELEIKDIVTQKREEQMGKEMERQDCVRREEQKMLLDQKIKEEHYQREERRVAEKREKLLQREILSAERRKQKEELRKEKEAAKQKAAMFRATTRRIAKESIELIEDERLELMELAASSKGLSSIVSLDFDTLQNLECFRESLCEFPPKSVKRKMPFSIEPWIASDENVGNLLMAWRFCINFADILRLWPFTLDELVQAFHDYDSRLLAEIHIALLKLIIKDIEDVLRAPPSGLGTNQYTAAHLEGGHPQIVERAYLWGFDICNWQKQLNLLTWPEVLRQFGLSAGFGPQLKKKSTDKACLNDSDEIKGCEDVVSALRSGSAAEAAVVLMQEKGLKQQNRSRHRLTPGTVKFAAYHVLALEGDKGLNVLDLANKIQKSGLRDLSTSRTPDASVSVALSRDPILFKRIAPSTYYVRPAYRKDPANAEAVLSAAREELQSYIKGSLAGQNAEDIEREDDSEGEVAEGPELVDLGTPSDANKNNERCSIHTSPVNRKSKLSDEVSQQNGIYSAGIELRNPSKEGSEIDESTASEPWVQRLTEGEYSDLCVEERLNALVALIYIANEGKTIRAVLEDRVDAANALKRQMWADAQLDKSRLKDGIINKFQNNSFYAATEGSQIPLEVPDSKHHEASPSTMVMDISPVVVDNVQNHHEGIPAEKSLAAQETFAGQFISPVQQNGNTAERLRMQLKSFIGHKADDFYASRSLPLGQDRRHNQYWMFAASGSSQDPGSGRIFVESTNGCWRLIDTEEAFDSLVTSLDTRGIRESHLYIMLQEIEASFKKCARRSMSHFGTAGQHGKISRAEATEGSSPVSDIGTDSPGSSICGMSSDGREPSSSFKIEIGKNKEEIKNSLRRYHDFQVWMWKECLNTSISRAMRFGKKRCSPVLGICDRCLDSFFLQEDLCPSCHRIFGNVEMNAEVSEKMADYSDNLENDHKNSLVSNSSRPLRIRLIKALLILLEVRLPLEALQSYWSEDCRKSWGLQLQNSSSAEDLLKILTRLESVIERDHLSTNFETTKELLGHHALSRTAASEKFACPGSVLQLPWIPLTTAAVALRLLELDSSISYDPQRKAEPGCEIEVDLPIVEKPSSRYASLKELQKVEPTEVDSNGQLIEESWDYLGNFHSGARSRHVVRTRGGGRPRVKLQKGIRSTPESSRAGIRPAETMVQVLINLGEARGQRHARGPRTLRRRRTEKKVLEGFVPAYLGHNGNQQTALVLPKKRGREEFGINVERIGAANSDSNSKAAIAFEGSDHKNTNGFRRLEPEYNVTSNSRYDVRELTDEDGNDDNGIDDNDHNSDIYQEHGQNLERFVELDGNDDSNQMEDDNDDQDSGSAVGMDYSD